MLSIIPEELFADFRLRNFGFMRRGNSVHISGRTFCGFSTMQFVVQDKGKFCPFFRKNFLLIFDYAILGS